MATSWKRIGNLLCADPEPEYHLLVWADEDAACTYGWLLLDGDGRTIVGGHGLPTEEAARMAAAGAYVEHRRAHATKEAAR